MSYFECEKIWLCCTTEIRVGWLREYLWNTQKGFKKVVKVTCQARGGGESRE